MKTSSILSALAAVTAVSATPTKTEKQQPNKRASLPTVTASGNGKAHLMPGVKWTSSETCG